MCGKVVKIGKVKNKRGQFVTLARVTAAGRNKNISLRNVVGVAVSDTCLLACYALAQTNTHTHTHTHSSGRGGVRAPKAHEAMVQNSGDP